ncbi:hypothetical protein [Halogranum gelatinilyticum]|uniref:hypothetical protein n=1 Tax=Halogranum gelatinilyticum TaxID=660521 RepID=UPI0011141765|nr:hypothetical protein [Halogranum gelatinilyticum]
MRSDSQRSSVLGLRFFVCPRCETVYALPEEERCQRCGDVHLDEITRTMWDDSSFFSPDGNDD